jgi:hypothetical protein
MPIVPKQLTITSHATLVSLNQLVTIFLNLSIDSESLIHPPNIIKMSSTHRGKTATVAAN